MMAQNEDALICDFAEVYNIYDYKSMPPRKAAIFAVGLPADSCIKMEMSGQKFKTETILLASIADALNLLVWFKTKDGQNNRNRPASILKEMMEEKEEYAAFDSIEAYEAARRGK